MTEKTKYSMSLSNLSWF